MSNIALVYLDNIIVYVGTFDNYMTDLYEVFMRITEYGLIVNFHKWVFYANSIEYLNYIIFSDSIRPDPQKVEVIQNIKTLSNIKQLQSFSGLAITNVS